MEKTKKVLVFGRITPELRDKLLNKAECEGIVGQSDAVRRAIFIYLGDSHENLA